MEEKLLRVKEILKEYNQEQLLDGFSNLSLEQQNVLLDEILLIDFEQMKKLYQKTKQKEIFKEAKIEPIEYIEKDKISVEDKKRYDEIGENIIKEGKYAVVTMAGGQRNKIRTPRAKRNL